MSGRREAQVLSDSRLMGQSSYIYEAGCGMVIDRERTFLTGPDWLPDERGNPVRGRGDQPNEHDMLTGSRADGTTFSPATDMTCKNWTSSTDGSAMVGHHDVSGPTGENWAKSWNFSHPTNGCSQQGLVSTGGAGKFYCFAAN